MATTTLQTANDVLPQYMMQDVAAHKDRTDTWIVIHGEVFDITKYIHDHPGGADVLIDVAGKDATEEYENAGHSEDALEIMQAFRVGTVTGAKKFTPKMRHTVPRVVEPVKPKTGSTMVRPLRATAVALGALTLLYAARRNITIPIAMPKALDAGRLLSGLVASSRNSESGGGFAGGFISASALSAIVGGFLVRRLSKMTAIETGFAQYPVHVKSTRVPKPDLNSARGFLNPKTFQRLPLIKKDEVAPSVYRLLFALPTPDTVLGLPVGQHVAIKAIVDGGTVTRSYTPVSNNTDKGVLELIIRCYADGLLTGHYLANLKVGDEVEFRGPKGAMKYRRGLCKKIGMLAGGTGITPMYQLIRAICEDLDDTTEVSLIYANRTEQDILLRTELENFARRYPKNFKLWYMLDKAPEQWTYGTGYVTKDIMADKFPAPAPDTKIMLCEMMTPWTAPINYRTRPVAILGAGVLGRRIACCWMSGGYKVHIRDPSAAQLEDCVAYIEGNLESYPREPSVNPGCVRVFDDIKKAVEDAWLVIEAVPEKLPLKIETFAQLEVLTRPDAILATNSSSYKSSQMLEKITGATKARVLNTHYYMPPALMVVELMTDGHTASEIFPFMVERQKEAGTIPYVARKESTGFIFNRLWAAVKREVMSILAEGVSVPEEIDSMWSLTMATGAGPCKMMDSLAPASNGIFVLDIGLSSANPSLDAGELLQMSPKGKIERVLVRGQALPDGLDVDPEVGRLFWTTMGDPSSNDGAVYSADLDGSDVRTVIPQGTVHTPKQLVLDRTARKVYLSDREGLRVMRCKYDGSDLETLVQTGSWENKSEMEDQTKWCVGIAISPKLGKFYWTQKGPSKGGKGRIFCAEIVMPEGALATSRPDVQCLLEGLPEPVDLELDESSNALYWTDRGELPFGNSLNRVQLTEGGLIAKTDFAARPQILSRNFNEAIGLKIDTKARRIYVTDLGGSVYQCDLDGNKKSRIFSDENKALTGITILN
ncbi:hypothetical protein QBC46DRAFT_462423 [Diplogelasinospora grovesii]|uniref:Uncharacterized protein n=1 Tax=Diplogelasinospora grovesii TaxID=303347 RepID=A0AAN6MZ01_9PEZI|nr:hypothetical protein QBC46DRAFT_462423 [Diplogelasinospora grovesii]